jgi:hypothetical protein
VSQVAALLVDALEDPKLKGAIGTAHAHTLICPHTRTHFYVHTHTHTYMSTHTRTLLCTLICTHMLMYRRALICIYMYLSTYLEIRMLCFTQTSSSIYFHTLFAFVYLTFIHLTTAYSIFFLFHFSEITGNIVQGYSSFENGVGPIRKSNRGEKRNRCEFRKHCFLLFFFFVISALCCIYPFLQIIEVKTQRQRRSSVVEIMPLK